MRSTTISQRSSERRRGQRRPVRSRPRRLTVVADLPSPVRIRERQHVSVLVPKIESMLISAIAAISNSEHGYGNMGGTEMLQTQDADCGVRDDDGGFRPDPARYYPVPTSVEQIRSLYSQVAGSLVLSRRQYFYSTIALKSHASPSVISSH
ncbi:unnamed protein product [Macrosiphum euphorbiae]|uniref:Uncharacterized protein n=1 Tax=Macrosiphum euphorbiae TaxID=13131 RepID=A0AAV0Y011_9HEMI|nr:unnamed protein product [Macrosiphum euphorbiae]